MEAALCWTRTDQSCSWSCTAGSCADSGRSPAAVIEQLRDLGYRRFTIDAEEVSSETASAKDVARIICRK